MAALVKFCDQIREIDSAIEYLRAKNILERNGPVCSINDCNRVMKQVKDGQKADKYVWRCPLHKSCKVSIRANSVVSQSRLELNQFVLLCYTWSLGVPCHAQEIMVSLSKHTVNEYNSYFRKICTEWLTRNPIKLGGRDTVVEISESRLVRKQCDKRQVAERWIFKLYDVKAKIGVLQFVQKRSMETLLPIIERVVQPGSLIHSYDCEVYKGDVIPAIPVFPPYKHVVVNNGENFAHSDIGASVSHVESFWKNALSKIKAINGSTMELLPSHMNEIMWRQIYGRYTLETYEHLLHQISVLHPVN